MFAVKTSGYSQRAVNIYKNCIGREYNPSERAWFFPNTAYEYLYTVFKNNDFNIVETIDPQDIKKIQVIVLMKLMKQTMEKKETMAKKQVSTFFFII